MNKREFIGHCFCDSRFRQLLDKIENGSLQEVMELKQISDSLKSNHRTNDLNTAFSKRLNTL